MAELVLSWRGAGFGLPYVKKFNIGDVMASPTIKEVKENKIELELAVLKLIQDFESANGVFAGYINVNRKHRETDYDEPEKPEKKGPVENVEISMDLDLIY